MGNYYRRLNIKLAPCRILRPKDFPSYEAAIWLEKRGNRVGLAKAVAPNITGYLSIVGEMDISLSTLGKKLIKLCSEARSNIVSFHLQDDNPIHYHHMLFALLRRHEEFINSIIFLMGLGRTDHAFAVMRMAYEAFLNFYLDWLSPQFIGPRLQLLSALRHQEANGEAVEDKNWSILANFPGLLENAADKARLSPLGKSYHDNLYPMLSLVAHQSYFNIEKEALTFDSDNLTNITDEKFLVCRLDFLTCALIRLIRNDVGQEIID